MGRGASQIVGQLKISADGGSDGSAAWEKNKAIRYDVCDEAHEDRGIHNLHCYCHCHNAEADRNGTEQP
jgi:hypothetical protein